MSDTSLSFRNADGDVLLVDLVAEPEMTTWLRAAARRLGLESQMIGEGIRTAIVLGAPLDVAIATRLSRVLDPPIELYVLDGEELRTL